RLKRGHPQRVPASGPALQLYRADLILGLKLQVSLMCFCKARVKAESAPCPVIQRMPSARFAVYGVGRKSDGLPVEGGPARAGAALAAIGAPIGAGASPAARSRTEVGEAVGQYFAD